MSHPDTLILLQALSDTWPELPGLVGVDWTQLETGLADLLERLSAERDPDQEAILRWQVMVKLRPYQAAFDRVQRRMDKLTVRSGSVSKGPIELYKWRSLTAQASTAELAGVVTRYTDIHLPARVQVDRRFSLIVGLTITPSPDSADAQPVHAGVGQSVRVVLAPAGALEVVGEREKELRVEAERDSDPVVFYLRAKQAGSHSLGLEFWVGSQIVATSRHSVEAVVEAVTEIPSRPAGQPIQAGKGFAAYPDLVLRITTEGNQLHYDLHFADVRFVSLPGERLRTNPETFRYELIREIEQMAMDAGKKGSSTLKIERQLAKIGQRLYKELFSVDLRREYRIFSRQITTLQIISDEPWIPWELIKPYDDEGGEIVDHDFLCMQFDLARWFTPAQAPAATIAVSSMACIAPSDSKLVEAQGERDDLQRLASETGLRDLTPARATYEAVVEGLLEGDTPVYLWHFACHGNFDGETPGKSPLLLHGRTPFTPDDIVGRAQTRLKTDRPLVFLNACRVGQSGLALTGMGGWAKVLVQDCAVGAFIAPIWEVDDVQARRFAATFYDFLKRTPTGTLARALRQARLALRELPEHDPTWLAYSLYAHPNARLSMDGV